MVGYTNATAEKAMSGTRRVASKLTAQEEEIINVSFDSFSDESVDPQTKQKVRYIDSDKLREAFQSIDASGDMADIQLLIDDIDENGDGRIDEMEWRAIMSRKFLGEEDDSSSMHVFMMLDDNKDGYIPLVELRKMLMQEGQAPLSEQEVDELLMFADLDADGLVNYRTFLRWLSAPEAYAKAHKKQQVDAATQALKTAIATKNKDALEDSLIDAKRLGEVDQDLVAQGETTLEQLSGKPAPRRAATAAANSEQLPGGKPAPKRAATASAGDARSAASQPPTASQPPMAQKKAGDKGAGVGLDAEEEERIRKKKEEQAQHEETVTNVMDFAGVDRQTAEAALEKFGGDQRAAIASLTVS